MRSVALPGNPIPLGEERSEAGSRAWRFPGKGISGTNGEVASGGWDKGNLAWMKEVTGGGGVPKLEANLLAGPRWEN